MELCQSPSGSMAGAAVHALLVQCHGHSMACMAPNCAELSAVLAGKLGRQRVDPSPSCMQVDVDTGEVLRSVPLPTALFGEGLTRIDDRLLQLTWHSGRALDFLHVDTFHSADVVGLFPADMARVLRAAGREGPYVRERDTGLHDGWGAAYDAARREVAVTDSSDTMVWLDPETLERRRSAVVRDRGEALPWVNELEMVEGEVRLGRPAPPACAGQCMCSERGVLSHAWMRGYSTRRRHACVAAGASQRSGHARVHCGATQMQRQRFGTVLSFERCGGVVEGVPKAAVDT